MNDICIVQNSIRTTYIFRKEYIARFIADGRRVYVIAPADCIKSQQALQNMGCKIVAVRKFNKGIGLLWSVLDFNWTITKFRLRRRNTTYLCFFLTTFIFSLPTLALFNKRLLLSVEGLGSFFTKRTFAKTILRTLIKRFTEARVFCNSDERNQIGQPSDIVTNGIGISLERFQSQQIVPHNGLTLVYVGRLIEDKGIKDSFAVLEKCLSLGLNVKLKVIGDYYPNNPSSLTHNDIECIKQKFGEHIEFLGFVQNIEELYTDSDVLLLPSVREGFPVCVMEASAMGIPTLTYNVPGCQDAVENGVNGYVSSFKDIDSIVRNIKKLIDSPELRASLRESSIRYAQENFDVKIKIDQLILIIEQVEQQA
ncbi:glycosyltransferase [Pseudidiomarina andamanensis]|uniref:Glycosyltransferase family 1 protein n=1 Tax=Pseudidiomarina andamanensis TaxID=1940690 RepID=A0AA92EUZ6_9GAMM|nr:glycosyltransferase [Pseudidiomarina andamanensis]MDS0217735.1 glycosyltransferase [Pseudidiomarina andamanensis]QGT96724.1 glycosyltransferase family 1 protein [Pseudidiomarina andamanensis]